MRPNRLRELIDADQPSLGTHILSTWPSVIELVGNSGNCASPLHPFHPLRPAGWLRVAGSPLTLLPHAQMTTWSSSASMPPVRRPNLPPLHYHAR